jgi:uncharacterized protein YnzC (UPF0291/DUF896 family)
MKKYYQSEFPFGDIKKGHLGKALNYYYAKTKRETLTQAEVYEIRRLARIAYKDHIMEITRMRREIEAISEENEEMI